MAALPSGFGHLADLLPIWGFATENERSAKRWSATPRQFQQFYDAMMPDLERILAFLSTQPLEGAPADVENLFHLTLAFAEASPHTEMYGNSAVVPNSFDATRFVATHGDCAA